MSYYPSFTPHIFENANPMKAAFMASKNPKSSFPLLATNPRNIRILQSMRGGYSGQNPTVAIKNPSCGFVKTSAQNICA
jgi:uncharacterized membrane-anchored protein YitT (DUF2179 family)